MDFNKPFTFDPKLGRWHLQLRKAQKDTLSECGLKITIDSGAPTGETAPIYQTKETSGLKGSKLEIRAFDNLAGWVSVVQFDLPTLLEKLVEIMPKDKMICDTYLLAQKDLEVMKNRKEKSNV
jgi:hypothetical protein